MRRREEHQKDGAEKTVREIRRATRPRFSTEEIRIVLEGLRSKPKHCRTVPAGKDRSEPVGVDLHRILSRVLH